MDPVTLGILGSVIGSAGGGILGALSSSSDRDKATAALTSAAQQIQAVGAPPDLAKQIVLNQLQSVGVYQPQMEQFIDAGISQAQQVQANPQLQQAQTSALQALQQAGQTGLRPQDVAAYTQIQNQIAQQAESQRQALMQQYQARGLGSSGAALASQLQASQAGQDALSQQGLNIAGNASQAALQAIQGAGTLGTQLQQQQENLGLAKAQAADAFKQFNVQNQMAIQNANTQNANQGQLYNLQNQQQIANANTQAANQELYRQNAAQQQQWQDSLAQAQGLANVNMGLANAYTGQANATAGVYGNIGKGVGAAAGALGGYLGAPSSSGASAPAPSNAANMSLLNSNSQSGTTPSALPNGSALSQQYPNIFG